MKQPHYSVIVEAHPPAFESEHLFVLNEKAHVQHELEKLRSRPRLLTALLPIVGELKPQAWKDYHRALEHYATTLNKHERDVFEGLMPVKFFVENLHKDKDEHIKISVHVEGGTIHPSQQPPSRPARVDGAQHVPKWKPTAVTVSTIVSGFSRSNVKLSAHSVHAEFSMLEGQDSADVVNQVLYIQGGENTRFTYEITSKRVKETEHGNITVV